MHDPAEFNRKFAAYFAAFIVFCIFIYLGAVTFVPMPKDNMDLAKQIVIFLLGSGLGVIIGFFYGASKQKEPSNFPQPTDVKVTSNVNASK